MQTSPSSRTSASAAKSGDASDWKQTSCILCECNCGLEVQVGGEGGRHLVRFKGDRQHPVSKGYVCEKAGRLDHYQNGPDRLLQPLRRRGDGSFETIDWHTAITEVAERLARTRDQHGGSSILYYGGGGQGNHLPGAYAVATRRALDMRYRSNALAQEKTGEFWVSHRMMGAQTRADFEHCDVALFLGKNPWFSHGIPHARVTLKQMAKDPERTLIVVDPRRTESAAMADIHLQVRPGTDAWLIAAMVAMLLEEDLLDQGFLDRHGSGLEAVRAAFADVDAATYCDHAGVPAEQVRAAARAIGKARAFASFEDLGVQMNRHSTLVRYLHRLLWVLTGNIGKPGTRFIPTTLTPLADGRHKRDTPVTGSRIIGGLVPCNVIAEEILTDHPKRFRAMIVETANPVHSLADSQRFAEALEALDTLVVIDVALTETARLADYVLPASTQFEKAEATFFNFEFPENFFHLRQRVFEPPEGPLSEAEIHSRLVEALGGFEGLPLDELRAAAEQGLPAYAQAFAKAAATDPRLGFLAPVVLYRTLGPSLPVELAEGAVLLGIVLRAVARTPEPIARAGFSGPPPVAALALFRAILSSPSGLVFSEDRWEEVMGRVGTADGRIELALDDLLETFRKLGAGPVDHDEEFPFVLSAGERRSFTANTIFRAKGWRKKDAEGALRMSPEDATALGLETGEAASLSTRRGSVVVPVEVTDSMLPGHLSLPNGMGLTGEGRSHGGVAPNDLTDAAHRDPYAGTPFHKSVPARVEKVMAGP
ncbi:MAG: molybdopterin-dependent oxidoreductase [Holophagales bacterium]|nr:molybdopterin-dependent oxidoreductase [Holophagales bacterium]